MIGITIDGRVLHGNEGDTILDVATAAGIVIPTLCHDKSLETYGACGICAVEAQGSPKLLRACSTVIAPGMNVLTNTTRVIAARRSVLELLLSDHIGDCRPPCMRACPAGTDCQGYVGLIATGDFQASYGLIMDKLPLPASIGRVCPHPCEEKCRRVMVSSSTAADADEPSAPSPGKPVAIADLKRFAADYALNIAAPGKEPNAARLDGVLAELRLDGSLAGKRVSVVGGGPGGLSAAYFLRRRAAEVTVYDDNPMMGGMLRYGIPEYRLPGDIIDTEVSVIEAMGVRLINNVRIGRDISLEHLRKSSDAVILAIGAWVSSGLRCPGEELPCVMGGINFLYDAATGVLPGRFEKVAVVGGGNTAMDACRTAVRLGAKTVYNIYRRTRAEMPAEDIEITEAAEEGVEFKFLCNPIEITAKDGKAEVRLQMMELGEPDASGRRAPTPVPGKEEVLEVDLVIAAVGQGVNADGLDGLELTKWRTIKADEAAYTTNLDGVFAIGDAINNGAGIAIEAIADAGHAAESVAAYLSSGKAKPYAEPFVVTRDADIDSLRVELKSKTAAPRIEMAQLSPEQRRDNITEIKSGFTLEQAVAEAERCLECGCLDYFECKLLRYCRETGVDAYKYGGENKNRGTDESSPFMILNRSKCILCGQCVRVCDEVMGRSALGLTERGFETTVSPALKRPLAETDCISCGQCVSLCPTGALGERLGLSKPIPLKEEHIETTCPYCGLGCQTDAAVCADNILRVLPHKSPASGASQLLCVRGRFGQTAPLGLKRVTAPMLRTNTSGEALQSVASYYEAYTALTKSLQRAAARHGRDAIAVSVSDRLTNEEIYLITKYAADTLGTRNVFSANLRESGLVPVLGFNSSTCSLDALETAEVILLVAPDIMSSHTIAGLKVKRAAADGAKVILIAGRETQADEWTELKLYADSDADTRKALNGLLEALTTECPGEGDIPTAAELLLKARNAVIVYDAKYLSTAAEALIANIATVTGHTGGIVSLKPNCNSQGLLDMGVKPGAGVLDEMVANGSVKALLVFGEDVSRMELGKLEFLAVFDYIATAAADMAHVLMPLAAPSESHGTYTDTERRLRGVNAAVPSPTGLSGLDMIAGLTSRKADPASVLAEIRRNVPGYANAEPGAFTYGKSRIDVSGARSQPVSDGAAYRDYPNTNAAFAEFERFLATNCLTAR